MKIIEKGSAFLKEDDGTKWEIGIEVHLVINHHRLQNLAQVVFSQNSAIVCVVRLQAEVELKTWSSVFEPERGMLFLASLTLTNQPGVVAQDGD